LRRCISRAGTLPLGSGPRKTGDAELGGAGFYDSPVCARMRGAVENPQKFDPISIEAPIVPGAGEQTIRGDINRQEIQKASCQPAFVRRTQACAGLSVRVEFLIGIADPLPTMLNLGFLFFLDRYNGPWENQLSGG
jgi:hypothetical protein